MSKTEARQRRWSTGPTRDPQLHSITSIFEFLPQCCVVYSEITLFFIALKRHSHMDWILDIFYILDVFYINLTDCCFLLLLVLALHLDLSGFNNYGFHFLIVASFCLC